MACKLGVCSWLCVLVSAQSYQEKRAVITMNDNDNVWGHKPISIVDFFYITFLRYQQQLGAQNMFMKTP